MRLSLCIIFPKYHIRTLWFVKSGLWPSEKNPAVYSSPVRSWIALVPLSTQWYRRNPKYLPLVGEPQDFLKCLLEVTVIALVKYSISSKFLMVPAKYTSLPNFLQRRNIACVKKNHIRMSHYLDSIRIEPKRPLTYSF